MEANLQAGSVSKADGLHAAVGHYRQSPQKRESFISRHRALIAAGVAYTIITLLMFIPVLLNMGTLAPAVGGDLYQNLWGLWWVNYATFQLHTGIFYTNMAFWPLGASLISQQLSPLAGLLTAPFALANPVMAYNIIFLLGFIVAGISMFLLADYLVKNKYAAFIAGLAFGFSAYHIAVSFNELHLMSIGWFPLAIYFFIRMVKEEKSYWNDLGLAASFVLIALMSDLEFALMSMIVMIIIAAAYAIGRETRPQIVKRQFLKHIAIAATIAFVLGSWAFIPIIKNAMQPSVQTTNSQSTVQSGETWSDDLLSFFLPSFYNGIFTKTTVSSYLSIYSIDPAERISYITYTVLALSVFAVYKNFKQSKLWLALIIIFGWLALGPYLQVGGSLTAIPGIYSIYSSVPILNVIREPGNFDLVVSMCFALLAAFGIAYLAESMKRGGMRFNPKLLYAIAAIAFLIESNGTVVYGSFAGTITTQVQVPQFYSLLRNNTSNLSIVGLPALPDNSAATPALYPGQFLYYSNFAAHKPLVGGYFSSEDQTQLLSLYNLPLAIQASNLQEYGNFTFQSPANENYTAQTLFTLYNYDTAVVAVDKQAYDNTTLSELELYMLNTFGQPIYNDNTTVVFSTSAAVNSSLYRSFVVYPQFSQWSPATIPYNGTSLLMWIPSGNGGLGSIFVYAPFANTADIKAQIGGALQMLNVTVRFDALASTPSALTVGQQINNSVKAIAVENVTKNIKAYSVKTTMSSGPYGNLLLFVSPQQTVAISNLTFSKG